MSQNYGGSKGHSALIEQPWDVSTIRITKHGKCELVRCVRFEYE